jgi:hypothetical protein
MNFNINITQGTTFSQQIVVTGKDYTDATGYCQIRKFANQDSPILATPVVTFPALPVGAIQIDLTAQETQAIPVTSRALTTSDTFQFDIKVENEGGIITQEVSGNAYVSPSVTFIS